MRLPLPTIARQPFFGIPRLIAVVFLGCGATAWADVRLSSVIGEIWICSGQSNMQFPLSGALNSQAEIADANLPMIRLFTVANRTSSVPLDDCAGKWVVCSPETANSFSAVGFFFGRHLNQALTTTKLPKVGMAVAIDLGDAKDIHPRNKQDVGKRLGLAAEAIAYNRKAEFSGPVFQGMKIEDGKAALSFAHTEGGLKAKGDSEKGFAICGADKKYVWAAAKIEGDKVVVSSPDVPRPVAVRYAWGDIPGCTLVNGAGLPAVPFRTEQ